MKGKDGSDTTVTVAVTVAFDGARTSPEEAADWVAKFKGQLGRAGLAAGGTVAATGAAGAGHGTGGDAAEGDDGIAVQLARLTSYSPASAPRVRRVHEDLVALGYVATLPTRRKAERLPSYISYIDPVTGQNLGNLNSEKFYVMRRELRDVLKDEPHVGVDSRYAHVALISDEAVAYLLQVAKEQKK